MIPLGSLYKMCNTVFMMHEVEIVKERIAEKLARAQERHADVTAQLDKSTAALKASRAEAAEAEAARDAARREATALEARARELAESELPPLLVERQTIADDLELRRAAIDAAGQRAAAEADQARRCVPLFPANARHISVAASCFRWKPKPVVYGPRRPGPRG